MIVRPTVLVLGAGASMPYGFPSGAELADRVLLELRRGEAFGKLLNERYGVHDLTIRDFIEAFPRSGCDTLDEFVESPGNRKYLLLVKAAIVEDLIGRESDQSLLRPPAFTPTDEGLKRWREYDWLSYLIRQMRSGTTADNFGADNKLRVITFNFDRSFERRLFLALENAYGIQAKEAGILRGSIDVLHMHGSLGGEKWLDENRPESRHYKPEASIEQRRELVGRLRLIHDEIDINDLNRAHSWLTSAHTICFLGFGFHRINLVDRLGMNEPHDHANICGTALGFTAMELEEIRRVFTQSTHVNLDRDRHILQYLRDVRPLPTEHKNL